MHWDWNVFREFLIIRLTFCLKNSSHDQSKQNQGHCQIGDTDRNHANCEISGFTSVHLHSNQIATFSVYSNWQTKNAVLPLGKCKNCGWNWVQLESTEKSQQTSAIHNETKSQHSEGKFSTWCQNTHTWQQQNKQKSDKASLASGCVTVVPNDVLATKGENREPLLKRMQWTFAHVTCHTIFHCQAKPKQKSEQTKTTQRLRCSKSSKVFLFWKQDHCLWWQSKCSGHLISSHQPRWTHNLFQHPCLPLAVAVLLALVHVRHKHAFCLHV